MALERRPGDSDGVYDCFQSSYKGNTDLLGEDIMQCIKKKGFCVIDTGITEDVLGPAQQEAEELKTSNQLKRPPLEVVDGLLGEIGSVGMAEIEMKEPEQRAIGSTALENLDGRFFELASCVAPWTGVTMGYEMASRTPMTLLEARPGAEEPFEELTGPVCWKWLHTFSWHRLMCIMVLGPDSGTLELSPMDKFSQSFEVEVRPGTCVILRADSLSHKLACSSTCFTLSSFFMEQQSDAPMRRKETSFPLIPVAKNLDEWLMKSLKTAKEQVETQEDLEEMVSRELQSMANQVWHRGLQIACRGMHVKIPGRGHTMQNMLSALCAGADCAEDVPAMRWDNERYYYSEPQDGYSVRDWYICKHVNLIEGIEMFDNKFFGLSIAESRGMDPLQRIMLEACYETCLNAGYRKPQLMRNFMGVFSGGPSGVQMEWGFVPKDEIGGALGSTNASCAILSNRLSYTFGLTGPNFLIDMDSTSSLMAVNMAVDSVSPTKYQCQRALALGIDLIMHPRTMCQLSWAGLMSPRGRSMTFDHTADGFIRGEGFGGMLFDPLLLEIDNEWVVDPDARRLGIASGTWAVNSGRTASLTAPSGAMDQELYAGALRRADISPLDVEFCEVYGASSLLSDAVEVTGLCRSYRGKTNSEEPFLMGTCKTAFGNARPAQGVVAAIKVLLQCITGCQQPSLHLLRLNPHMLLEDSAVGFVTEGCPNLLNTAFGSVTAKGFGGNCVHCIFWGSVDPNHVTPPKQIVKHEPIVYWPGGGGELMNEAVPLKYYTIVGSWTEWNEPEPMESEGKGVYGFTVTLNDHLVEKFQIWLDGDSDKVLHPGMTGAFKDSMVRGPASGDEASGCYWMIDGSTQTWEGQSAERSALSDTSEGDNSLAIRDAVSTDDFYKAAARDQGKPGFQYRVRLMINGQYRNVRWEKVMEGADPAPVVAKVPESKYYVMGNWTGWDMEAMTSDTEGLWYVDTQLAAEHSQFYIVRNKDWRQMIYPQQRYVSDPALNGVLGPDEYGSGYTWYINCKPGDVYRIELQRTFEYGACAMKVSWRYLKSESIPAQLFSKMDLARFCLVSTADRYSVRHYMENAGEFLAYEVNVPAGKTLSFLILENGDWNAVIYPDRADATKESVLKGPNELYEGKMWTLGKHSDESGRWQVQLRFFGNKPASVTWERP
mmetsp:Transcript_77901/g.167118  ORF Transcript_77901/g.167118 Transcript_77901/m.167118 type:complete len:1167 (+) Transcript_77901:110-3610(+)